MTPHNFIPRSKKSVKGKHLFSCPYKHETHHRASGSVYVAKTLATGRKIAIKQMDLAQQPRKELIVNEIIVMKESQHPNVVNFLEAFLVHSNELWVVMEFMEGGALTDIIEHNGSLQEDQIAAICLETCRGLQHLHSRSIIHRDIKSDNILMNTSGEVKISVSNFSCPWIVMLTLSRLWFLR